jgi:hypothetical protein
MRDPDVLAFCALFLALLVRLFWRFLINLVVIVGLTAILAGLLGMTWAVADVLGSSGG